MMKIPGYLIFLFIFASRLPAQPVFTTTIEPFRTILQEVAGSRASITVLLPAGASPHTYEPPPSQIVSVNRSTALFFGSPQLDGWISRFPDAREIELLGMIPDSLVLYFEENGAGKDPHFWTDPLTVKAMLPALADTLSQLDTAGAEIYHSNAMRFAAELDSLSKTISQMLKPFAGRPVILAHPFFRYFLRRYKIPVLMSIETIPGKEPTPRGLKKLIQLSRQERVSLILSHPQINDRTAELLSESTGVPILQLNPFGSGKSGETYQEILTDNARLLREALHE
ncbi:MAG: metal ABC transporter substrate-binding protein [Calditrichia bacterium]